jgi:hypothetical protein
MAQNSQTDTSALNGDRIMVEDQKNQARHHPDEASVTISLNQSGMINTSQANSRNRNNKTINSNINLYA